MTTDDTGPIPIETEDRWALEDQLEVAQARTAELEAQLEAQLAAETIAAAAADLLEPEPEGEERTILQWAKGDCDSCHCEFQAGRSRVRVVTRLICEECEMYKKGRIDGVRELAAALAKPAPEVS